MHLPLEGGAFLSLNDSDKLDGVPLARDLQELGFKILATAGTAQTLRSNGVSVGAIFKVEEGRPNVVDRVKNGEIHLIVNTPLGKTSRYDEVAIGEAALRYGVPMITTLSGAQAAVRGIRFLQHKDFSVRYLQEIHAVPEAL